MTDPRPGPADPPPELSALDMAHNLTRHVREYARAADDDPLQAHAQNYGGRQAASAELASRLALVSIADDIHRIADVIVAGPGPEP